MFEVDDVSQYCKFTFFGTIVEHFDMYLYVKVVFLVLGKRKEKKRYIFICKRFEIKVY